MARGSPRLWGLGLGLPTVLGGLFALLSGGGNGVPPGVGYPFLGLGAMAVLLGVYVDRVAPEQLDVEPVRTFKPSQLGAYLLGGASLLPLVGTLYLLFGTRVPYVWPTLAFALFVLLFVKALVRYWQNSLTTYYVTADGRIISEYRFLSLRRASVDVGSVETVVRDQSVVETLTGLGSVVVRSASGNVSFRDLASPAAAERLLNEVT